MKKLLLLLLLTCVVQVNAQLCFSPADSFAVGTNPLSVISADFNGDGKLDLATANTVTNDVSILLGTGTGSFGAASNFTVGGTNLQPYAICSADFNGDGKKDLAVGNRNSTSLSVLLGTGTGTFGTPTNFTLFAWAHSIISADFNKDGFADLAIANKSTNRVAVLLGTGTGGFGVVTNFLLLGGIDPISIISTDFNGDGFADLATANGDNVGLKISNTVAILLGTGTGSFSAATYFTTGSNPVSITSADFNGDGFADLATANSWSGTNNISVLLGTGTGSFGTVVNFPVGVGTNAITSADFNGDTKVDLAVTDNGTGNISVLLGTGTGSFGAANNFAARGFNSIISADFNGDTKVDLATVNLVSNNAYLLLNCTAVGIANFSNDQKEIFVYPNPVNQYVTIEFTGEIQSLSSIKLYDMIGKEIPIENKIFLNSNKRKNIDLSFLPVGIYFLKLGTNEGTEVKKIIKN